VKRMPFFWTIWDDSVLIREVIYVRYNIARHLSIYCIIGI
jgi:hypothetical protein